MDNKKIENQLKELCILIIEILDIAKENSQITVEEYHVNIRLKLEFLDSLKK